MSLTGVAAFLLAVFGVLLLILVGLLFVEIVASLRRLGSPGADPVDRPSIAVLVPAHDEALSIVATLKSIRSELTGSDRLVVVADNCTDRTAELARTAGAEVVERHDPTRRGKGFALDYGVRHLALDPPDVVIINDADCWPEAGAYSRIAVMADQTSRPVQAVYAIGKPQNVTSLYLNFAVFAIRVKNLARPLGCHRLGLPSQLMGTGMAFPWALISKANLATSEIVEDLAYGLEFAKGGHPPMYCPSAVVASEFPVTQEGQGTQRTRWDSGHLNTIAHSLPGLLVEAVRSRNFALLAMVLDAAIPPLAFLAILIVAFGLLAVLMALLGGSMVPLSMALAAGTFFAIAVLLAWWRVGRDTISLAALACAPVYVLSKLALYSRVLAGRKVEWIRSKRDT
jgi:cellulose synthase/poly-beta-1,6-N-acetylglucosamine synthase-like glycosyltransferase